MHTELTKHTESSTPIDQSPTPIEQAVASIREITADDLCGATNYELAQLDAMVHHFAHWVKVVRAGTFDKNDVAVLEITGTVTRSAADGDFCFLRTGEGIEAMLHCCALRLAGYPTVPPRGSVIRAEALEVMGEYRIFRVLEVTLHKRDG